MPPEPVLSRHADHDPALICRPAFGYGLCEVLEERSDDEASGVVPSQTAATRNEQTP